MGGAPVYVGKTLHSLLVGTPLDAACRGWMHNSAGLYEGFSNSIPMESSDTDAQDLEMITGILDEIADGCQTRDEIR